MLSLWQYRTARVITKDGLSYLLKNILYILGLRVNLISIRRLYKDGIEGHFNTKDIYFKKDNKRLIYV